MKLENKRFVVVISLAVIIVVISLFVAGRFSLNQKASNLSVNNTNNQNSGTQEEKVNSIIDRAIQSQLKHPVKANEDVVDENGNGIGMGTTPDHWKELGISNAQVSSEEEKNLYQMTTEAVKAELKYSSNKDEKFLEAVKNLYLPEGFEQYKKDITSNGGYHPSDAEYQAPTSEYLFLNDIKTIRFSKPRVYQGLPDMIGVVNDTEFNSHDSNSLIQIFIFKNVNGEWKIDKQRETVTRFDIDENTLIKEIKDGK